jgi:hypothetical protein
MSHNFINKLTVIIGSCQLLQEKAERAGQLDPECLHRLAVIQDIARGMAEDLKEHQCELDSIARMEIFGMQSKTLKVLDGKH